MKKKILKTSLVILLLLAVFILIFFSVYMRTFSNFVVDENFITVFYPEGAANRYKCFILWTEDHRVWQYELNKKEAERANDDLTNDVWQALSEDDLKYIDEVYFCDSDPDCTELFEYNEADEIYYCLYDLNSDGYRNIDANDTVLIAEKQLLFVYNKTTAEYYCVSRIA